jgi:hypothetical protein
MTYDALIGDVDESVDDLMEELPSLGLRQPIL